MASRQQTELIKYWEDRGYFVLNLIVTSKAGMPDLVCLKHDKVVFVESKEKTDRLSKLQIVWLNRLTKMGFDCYLNFDKYEPKNDTNEAEAGDF